MKTDRELLELAAKAAGIEIHESDDGTLQRRPVWCMTYYVQGQPYGETRWDPLHDDAQALRLQAILGLDVCYSPESVEVVAHQHAKIEGRECVAPWAWESILGSCNPSEATRRAIVRAASAIGEAMP